MTGRVGVPGAHERVCPKCEGHGQLAQRVLQSCAAPSGYKACEACDATGVVPVMVRAISLWQPWASACFHVIDGRVTKGVETRHWSTDYRGPLVIHAAKRWGPDERRFAGRHYNLLPADLPRGVLLGVVHLVDVVPTEELYRRIKGRERMFGNYDAGRFGWILERPRLLPTPIVWPGRQSFFSVPEAVLA